MAYTEQQLKDAARKALAAGDTAAAKRLTDAARAAGAGAAVTPPAPAGTSQVVTDPRVNIPAGALPAEPPGMIETIMSDYVQPGFETTANWAGYGAQELARGAVNVLGAPVDLVNASPMLLNILPGEQGMQPFSDRPFMGSRQIWDAITAPRDIVKQDVLGVEGGDQQPTGMGQRIFGRVMNEIGANALPVGAALTLGRAMGPTGARAMQESGNALQSLFGRMAESAAVSPATFAGREMGMATGAGLGAGLAREAYSDGDPNTVTGGEAVADLIGAIFGGLGVAGAQAGLNAAKDMGTAVTGMGANTAVKDAVAGQLAEAANAPLTPAGTRDTTGLAQTLAGGARRVTDVVPGFRPSTADVTQNPGLANLEYGRQTGPNAGLYADTRAANTDAAAAAIDANAPTATPGAFRDALETRRTEALTEADSAVSKAQAEFETAAANLQAVQSGEARGQTVRAALDEALGKAREVEREAWSAVQGEADVAPLASSFDDVTAGLTLAEREALADVQGTLSIPSRLMPEDEVAAAAGVPVRLDEITGLRSRLTTAQRQASAAGDPNKARVLEKYVAAVDQFLDGTGAGDALANARQISFDLNERFTRRGTPTAEALASRPSGGPIVPDSRVTPQFVQPDAGQASNSTRLLRETAGVTDTAIPEGPSAAKQALADQILADVQSRGLIEKPDQLQAYLAQYDRVFSQFPELRRELGTAAALRTKLTEAQAAKVATERTLGTPDKAGTSQVAKYLAFGDERAVDAMSGVVNAKDPARAADELLSFAGNDPQTLEGARAAFWKLMEREGKSKGATTRGADGAQPWRPASIFNFLNDPKVGAVAQRLYADNPEHLDNVKAIAETLRTLNFRDTGKVPNSSGTPQALRGSDVLPTTETLGAYSFAYQRGQVGLPFIGLRLVSTMARKATLKGKGEQFQKLLDQALLDPELAALLLRENNPANVEAMSRAAKSWLGVRSAWVDDLLAGDEPAEDEDSALVDTIMGDQ